jgi:hypothetical protein
MWPQLCLPDDTLHETFCYVKTSYVNIYRRWSYVQLVKKTTQFACVKTKHQYDRFNFVVVRLHTNQ